MINIPVIKYTTLTVAGQVTQNQGHVIIKQEWWVLENPQVWPHKVKL